MRQGTREQEEQEHQSHRSWHSLLLNLSCSLAKTLTGEGGGVNVLSFILPSQTEESYSAISELRGSVTGMCPMLGLVILRRQWMKR